MDRLEIIGFALFCGITFAAFLAPIVLFVWWLDRRPKREETDG